MNIFEKFREITNISINKFYSDVIDFFDNYHQNIVDYYTNYNYSYPTQAFSIYSSIKERLEDIISKINLCKGNFNNIDIWDLVEQLDELKLKLENVEAYPRIYQVGFYKKQNNVTEDYETYVLKAHETIESVARDYNQNATDLVLINALNEERWTEKGGTKIILKTSKIDSAINNEAPTSVFDVLLGKNLLGKDFPNYFEIDEEEEDITILSPENTFLQAVQNLFELKAGAIPEYLSVGVAKDVYQECSSNMGFQFPIMLRQLMEALETDDTILTFEISDIEFDKAKSAYTVYATVQNRLGDNLKFITNL